MKTRVILIAGLLACVHVPAVADSSPRMPTEANRHFVVPGPGVLLSSSSSVAALGRRELAGPDTFVLYGGPGELVEGKFQLEDGLTPDWGDGTGDLLPGNYGGGPGAWESHDLLDLPVYWHRSQFRGDTLGPAGNWVFWSGSGNGDPNEIPVLGWASPPGYGNRWSDTIIFTWPMTDPSIAQTVAFDFDFSSDTEPGYDYFIVDYDSAGTQTEVLRVEGAHTGTSFTAEARGAIDYAPFAYGGYDGNQIEIRLRAVSDGAWSDEDGIFPTNGAVQIDNVTLSFTDGVSPVGPLTEDFEEAKPDSQYLFGPDKARFPGDFAEVYASMSDIDPCRDNTTPVIGFIDFGQTVRNWKNHPEYLADGDSTTGGSLSGTLYGISGNFVTNYTGGLSYGEFSLTNEIWSPWIAWDLEGPADDGVGVAGAFVRWSVWSHLPLSNGIFYVWHVRGVVGTPGVDAPSKWADRNFVYFDNGIPGWYNYVEPVTDLLPTSPDYVQIAFGAWDYAYVFGFPGNAATPSPVFDNVALYKHRIGGPALSARAIDQAQDAFPTNGSIDTADPDLLDIPFDMARDVNNYGLSINKGDSVLVDVKSLIPGAVVTDIRMVWALKQNSDLSFNEVQPSRPKDENFQDLGNGIWSGEVVADTARTSVGGIVQGRYFVDLPDQDFLHPGAILHYYFQATDSDGRTSTLPANTEWFGDFTVRPFAWYDRMFTVRGLPTLADDGSQPDLLVLNDFGHRGGEASWLKAMYYDGWMEGEHYDTYTTKGPSSSVSNGIGYATPGQLDGYRNILYMSGDLDTGLLSNGDPNQRDKADDLGIINDWLTDFSSPRNIALFGDNVVSGNIQTAEGVNFVGSVLGVDVLGNDVRPVIGGQTAPGVVPNSTASLPDFQVFSTEFVAYGGCLSINHFDQIQPLIGAEAGHYFLDPDGIAITSPFAGVASVLNDHGNGLAITFPYSQMFIQGMPSRIVPGEHPPYSARDRLFAEVLNGLFSKPQPPPPWVGGPPAARRSVLTLVPNPFNPVTEVAFSNTFGKTGSVKVFDLRGRLVRTLHEGEYGQPDGFSALWDGTDDGGALVASGVYVIQARADGQVETKKAALVK